MNKNKIILFVGIIGAIGVGVILLLSAPDPHRYDKGSHLAIINSPQTQSSTQNTFESRIDTQGEVTVDVTPTLLSSKDSEWKFNIGLNTHSVSLDQDMTKVSTLVDDKGNEYTPLSWEGAGPGGHHVQGILTFKPITPTPKSVKLKIVNVGAPVRTFVWNIIN